MSAVIFIALQLAAKITRFGVNRFSSRLAKIKDDSNKKVDHNSKHLSSMPEFLPAGNLGCVSPLRVENLNKSLEKRSKSSDKINMVRSSL